MQDRTPQGRGARDLRNRQAQAAAGVICDFGFVISDLKNHKSQFANHK
jgi:hypothetical protein